VDIGICHATPAPTPARIDQPIGPHWRDFFFSPLRLCPDGLGRAGVFGAPRPCSTRGLVVFVIALTTGAAAGFLTASAKRKGKLPFLGTTSSVLQPPGHRGDPNLVVGFRLYVDTPNVPISCQLSPPRLLKPRSGSHGHFGIVSMPMTGSAYQILPSAIREKSPLPSSSTSHHATFRSRCLRRELFESADRSFQHAISSPTWNLLTLEVS